MLKIVDGGKLPKIKTEFSSSADLYARKDITIRAGETKIIPLGVKIDLEFFKSMFQNTPKPFFGDGKEAERFSSAVREDMNYKFFLASHFFELKLRSSLAVKQGLIINNGVGEIDIDYPDEIGLIVHKPLTMELSDCISKSVLIQHIAKEKGLSDKEVEETAQEFVKTHEAYSDVTTIIKAGDRVAQIKLMEHKNHLMPQEYRSTQERLGGFGSTGSEG